MRSFARLDLLLDELSEVLPSQVRDGIVTDKYIYIYTSICKYTWIYTYTYQEISIVYGVATLPSQVLGGKARRLGGGGQWILLCMYVRNISRPRTFSRPTRSRALNTIATLPSLRAAR